MASSENRPSGRLAIGRVVRSRGFTLLELMIVVAIIAILAAVAYPSYINYVVRTKRNAAEACLSEYANYMERYYTTNLSYSGANTGTNWPTLDCASTTQTGDNYGYAASASTAAYTVTATPLNSQLARDATCGTLAIDQSGQRYVKGTDAVPADVSACWK